MEREKGVEAEEEQHQLLLQQPKVKEEIIGQQEQHPHLQMQEVEAEDKEMMLELELEEVEADLAGQVE